MKIKELMENLKKLNPELQFNVFRLDDGEWPFALEDEQVKDSLEVKWIDIYTR